MFRFLSPTLLLVLLLLLPLILTQPPPPPAHAYNLHDCRINHERRATNYHLCVRSGSPRQFILVRLLTIGRCADCTTPSLTLSGFGMYCGRPPCSGYRCASCTVDSVRRTPAGVEINLTENMMECLRRQRATASLLRENAKAIERCSRGDFSWAHQGQGTGKKAM